MKASFSRLIFLLLLPLTACTGVPAEIATVTMTPSFTVTPLPTHSSTVPPTQTLTPSPTIPFTPTATPEVPFTFVITGDTGGNVGLGAYDTSQYFRGACESILNLNPGAFMITAGDTHPTGDTRWTIDQVLGSDYLWYPVIGNHELLEAEDMAWLRSFQPDINGDIPPNLVRLGPDACPETSYSFDFSNAHFVVLNVFCREDGDTITDGAITDEIYYWLEGDLAETQKEHIFIIGHEPAFPQPDASAGIIRHEGDSLDKYPVTRDRFWALLKARGVRAYINGHTHSYSVVKIDGVWQVDVGHTNGAWTQSTASTFILMHVSEGIVSYETYRTTLTDGTYVLKYNGVLD